MQIFQLVFWRIYFARMEIS